MGVSLRNEFSRCGCRSKTDKSNSQRSVIHRHPSYSGNWTPLCRCMFHLGKTQGLIAAFPVEWRRITLGMLQNLYRGACSKVWHYREAQKALPPPFFYEFCLIRIIHPKNPSKIWWKTAKHLLFHPSLGPIGLNPSPQPQRRTIASCAAPASRRASCSVSTSSCAGQLQIEV